MSYLPLARKYRPQNFDELIGQPHVTETLTRALEQNRLAQVFLFAGTRGVGKTSAARILAKCLNCEQGPTPKPCNRCANCTQITQGNSLDVMEIDGASNRGIDEIRSLRESVPFAPMTGKFHVYIIDEVHMLTTEAFNALLKTLEEPPQHVKFIFATTAPNKLPATILSRCQRFDFRRIEPSAMVDLLKRLAKTEKLKIEEPALYAIARASDGSLRDAEVILEQLSNFAKATITESHVLEMLGSLEPERLFEWTQAILERNTSQALSFLKEQLEQGKDAPQLLAELTRHMRNLLIARSTQEASSRAALLARLIDEPAERLERLDKQSSFFLPQELLLLLQILSSAYETIRRSPLARTILELVIIKLATRENWLSLDQISKQLQRLNSSLPPLATPVSTTQSSLAAATVQTGPSHQTLEHVAPVKASPLAGSEPFLALSSSVESDDVADSESNPEPADHTFVPRAVQEIWPTFLERLGSQKMSLAAYLAEARALQLESNILTVGLPGFRLHQEVLDQQENRRLIERLLTELIKTPVSVQYTTLPQSSSPAEDPKGSSSASIPTGSPSIVQDIVNLFNATIINPPPHPT